MKIPFYMSIPTNYITFDFIFIIAIIIFVCSDLIKRKNTGAVFDDYQLVDMPLNSPDKNVKVRRGIKLLILQFLITYFIVGRQSFKIFIAFEIAAIPITLIHIWAGLQRITNINVNQMNKLSKIGGVITFLYSKFLLVMVIQSILNDTIYIQTGAVLYIVFEALGIYIAVSHLILGITAKQHPVVTANMEYSDLNFLLSDIRMKRFLFIGITRMLLNLCSSFIPYPMQAGVWIIADILMIIFMTGCFLQMEKLSFVKIVILLGIIGAAAGFASDLVFISREYQVICIRSYINAFIFLRRISTLIYISLPLGLILSKITVPVVKTLSYAVTSYGLLFLFLDNRMPTIVFYIGQLLFLSLLISLAFSNKKTKVFTGQATIKPV